jgi:hypothetical protein
MIEREFIPYDRALTLKELGFDEPCLGYYMSDEGIDTFLVIEKCINVSWLTLAPTFSQVFRFFREKHNILANVYANASGFLYQWEDAVGGTHRGFSDFEGPNDSGVWDTYEEAELACIDKLIELVKEAKEL